MLELELVDSVSTDLRASSDLGEVAISEDADEVVLLDEERLTFGGEVADLLPPAGPILEATFPMDLDDAFGTYRELGLTLPMGLLPLLDALRSRSAMPIALPGIRTADRPRVGAAVALLGGDEVETEGMGGDARGDDGGGETADWEGMTETEDEVTFFWSTAAATAA